MPTMTSKTEQPVTPDPESLAAHDSSADQQAQGQPDTSSAADNSAAPAAPPAPVVKTVDDFCKVVGANFDWFKDHVPEPASLTLLQKLTDFESFKQTDSSFQLNVAGSTNIVQWVAPPPDATEKPYIQGQSDGFSMSDAMAMVALASVKGWKEVTVSGSEQEKELMWLAAKTRGLNVSLYEPGKDTAVYQQWQKMNPGAAPASDAAKPEPQKTDLSGLSVQELKEMHDRLLSEEKAARAQKQAVNKELAARKGTAVKQFTHAAQNKPAQPKTPRHGTSKFVKDQAPQGRHEATKTNPAFKIPKGAKTGRDAHAKPS